MTLYPLKVRLQTFLSVPVTQTCQILSCDSLVANERYICSVRRCLCCMCRTSMPTGDETYQSQVTEISTRKRAAYTWDRGDFEEGSSLPGTGLHAWWKNQTDSHISGRPGQARTTSTTDGVGTHSETYEVNALQVAALNSCSRVKTWATFYFIWNYRWDLQVGLKMMFSFVIVISFYFMMWLLEKHIYVCHVSMALYCK